MLAEVGTQISRFQVEHRLLELAPAHFAASLHKSPRGDSPLTAKIEFTSALGGSVLRRSNSLYGYEFATGIGYENQNKRAQWNAGMLKEWNKIQPFLNIFQVLNINLC